MQPSGEGPDVRDEDEAVDAESIPPEVEEVLDDLGAATMALPRVTSFSVDTATLDITVENGCTRRTINLSEQLGELVDMEREPRKIVLGKLAKSLASRPVLSRNFKDVQAKLYPVIVPVGHYGLDEEQKTVTPAICRVRLPMLLEVVTVEADPGVFVDVDGGHLEAWGQEMDAVVDAAYDNLAARAKEDELVSLDDQQGVTIYQLEVHDGLASSRLLVPELLAAFAEALHLKGELVLAMPEQNTVLLAERTAETVSRTARVAAQLWSESDRSLSPALYGVDSDGDLVPLEVDAEDALFTVVDTGEVMLRAALSEQQSMLLNARFDAANSPFVAPRMEVASDDSEEEGEAAAGTGDGAEANQNPPNLFTYVAWLEGVPSFLPEADLLLLAGRPAEARNWEDEVEPAWEIVVPFLTAVEVLDKHLVPEPDLDPPRYRTHEWPNAELLARLREHAVASGES